MTCPSPDFFKKTTLGLFKDTTIKSINQERFGRWAAIIHRKSPKEEKKHLPNNEKSGIFLPRKDRSSIRHRRRKKTKRIGEH
jgi:hypothetical protein